MRQSLVPALLVGSLLIGGCGSTSNIRSSAPGTDSVSVGDAARYQRYATVVVRDFVDRTDKDKIKADALEAYNAELQRATRDYADMLAGEIRSTGAFAEVLREPSAGDALVIDGSITRYTSGNAALRLLIGFGAGSSYFDATVDLTDQMTGEQLGHVVVDRNSWGLGGGIAAGQTVEGFMRNSAKKIAEDLADLKTGTTAASK